MSAYAARHIGAYGCCLAVRFSVRPIVKKVLLLYNFIVDIYQLCLYNLNWVKQLGTLCGIRKEVRTMKKALLENFKKYGIAVNGDNIYCPSVGVWCAVFLKEGNSKTGKKVYTFSILPTNQLFQTKYGIIPGTCPCHCSGCYATKGNYNFENVRNALAVNTLSAYKDLSFLDKAIRAQLDTLPGVDIRIHAAGDFFSKEYAEMWRGIVADYPNNKFWTYTKSEHADIFHDLENGNIVKSILPCGGFNFGHLDYILDKYAELTAMGEEPYICKCGFDPSQHCENCRGCIEHKYVLFAEHSTGYKAEKDPLFQAARDLVEKQKNYSCANIAEYIAELRK